MRLAGPALAALLMACGSEAPSPRTPAMTEAELVVPGTSLPGEISVQDANNNLDVVRHDGRVFFAFRTAPSHFASRDTEIHVLSSSDEQSWRFEASFALGTDLREPRFLSVGGRLFLYIAELGEDPLDFEPHGFKMTEYLGPQDWTDLEFVYEPGFILWRSKVIEGRSYVTAYRGGAELYDETGGQTEVQFLTTTDGETFDSVAPGQPRVEGGGGTETAFSLLEDGTLISVIRNEAGDDLGWGSKICRAESDRIGQWTCVGDPRKYDSPLMFVHDNVPYLIARRSLANGGRYDLEKRELSHREQTWNYQLEWSGSPKRCALWTVDPESLEVSHLLDLPSRGDTCFPGILELDEDRFAVYNYSSPIDGEDLNWLDGQLGPTNIYRLILDFAR